MKTILSNSIFRPFTTQSRVHVRRAKSGCLIIFTPGPEQGSTATDRPSPSYSPMSETNPLVPNAGLSNTADVMSASDDVMSTGDVTSSSSVVTTSAGMGFQIIQYTSH